MKSNTNLKVIDPQAAPTQPTPVETAYQLERDVHEVRRALHRLEPLPNLQLLRGNVTDALARQQFAATAQSNDAVDRANAALAAALAIHDQHADLTAQRVALEQRLDAARVGENKAAIDAANARIEEALSEYKAMSLAAARAWRKLHSAAAIAGTIPGARHIQPPLGFHVPHLAVDGDNGPYSLARQMMFGRLPWETE